MLRQMFQALLRGSRRRTRNPVVGRPFRFTPAVQFLEQREVPAVLASFSGGVLVVVGDGADDAISVNFDAAGTLLVSGGSVAVVGGAPTAATLTQIAVFGYGGNDTIALGEAHGALPRAFLFGGDGNDILIGGSGADHFFGQAGNDSIVGNGGADLLFGDDGNDILVGNTGSDQAFGNAGDDLTIWNNGDGSDLFEGGTGTDTVLVNGGTGDEVFAAAANGTRVRFDRTTAVAFSLDIGTSESLVVSMNAGNDTFTGGALAGLILLTVDGGSGDDTLNGGNGNDALNGGSGNDFIDGNQGADTALMGSGSDTFQWDPGDGSDVVEGQDGTDTLLFNGSAAAELFDASANGARLRFTRNVGGVVLDIDDLEVVTLNALGGADAVTVNSLAGTDVTTVNVNLAVAGVGDAAADTVILNGTAAADTILAVSTGTSVVMGGLGISVTIAGSEAASDRLTVNGLGGNDALSGGNLATLLQLTLDGGADDDTLLGGNGADFLLGGTGADFIDGNQGNDTALMGDGNDLFQWDPGDGSDVIEGGTGTDTLLFNGSAGAEIFDASANGARLRFTRNVGNVVLDTDDIEVLTLNALGGADAVTINDLTATDVRFVNIDLGVSGAGDAALDAVTVNGSAGADVIGISGGSGSVTVQTGQVAIAITNAEPANDTLTVNGGVGQDTVNAASLGNNSVLLTLNGGVADDVLVGSNGNDTINGDAGNDILAGGNGSDTLDGGADTDLIDGGAGNDTAANGETVVNVP